MESSDGLGLPTAISLFAGAGGLDIAAERAGLRTVARVEFDRYAQGVIMSRVRAKQLDDAPLWDDVTTFDGRPFAGLVDSIFGGFPCQDVSVAGKRKAGKNLVAGTRSGLWADFARIIRDVGPSSVLVENVPGLLTGGLGDVLRDLAEMGYDARWEVLSAADVGAPHLRERVFVVAFRLDALADAARYRQRAAGPRRRDDGDAWQRSQSTLANAKEQRERPGFCAGEPGGQRRRRLGDRRREGPPHVADAERRGLRRRVEHREDAGAPQEISGEVRQQRLRPDVGAGSGAFEQGDAYVHAPGVGRWWAVEPPLGRVVNGLAHRVDRLRLCGNGVVPDQALPFFQEIVDFMNILRGRK